MWEVLALFPIAAMASHAPPFPVEAAEFFLVVNPDSDMTSDQSVVKMGVQNFISLKGDFSEALKRYVWRCQSREALVAELGKLRMLRFTLTHAGMSAFYLGYLRFELRSWRQCARGLWHTMGARVRGDLLVRIVLDGVELWTSQFVPMPPAAMLCELYDSEHAVVVT